MSDSISNTADIIDSRDVIARIEELSETRDALREEFETGRENDGVDFANWVRNQEGFSSEEYDELLALEALAEQGEGYGDWEHGETLVRESCFKEYAQELAEDIGAIKADATWPNNCIDWDQAARELQMDYTTITFDGVDYLMRA